MKKLYAVIFLLAMGTTAANAQDKSVRFGLKAAPNLSFIKPNTKNLKNDGARMGYSYGLMADFLFGVSHNYAFATGLYLNNTGTKSTYPYMDRNLERITRYQYIELPLTLKLKTNEIGYMTYYGQIGFGTAFNISAKGELDQVNADDPKKVDRLTDENLLDHTNLFKASLILGAGLEFNFSGNTSAMVGITYNNGFSNILKKVEIPDGAGNTTKLDANLKYFELSLGVFF